MTPKEKAIELYHRFSRHTLLHIDNKKCALIAVDEIYNEIDDNFDNLHSSDRKHYWQQVKQEIELL